MLFNDKSGSMAGIPFNTLKIGCLELADTLFDDEKNKFDQVSLVFYDSHPY